MSKVLNKLFASMIILTMILALMPAQFVSAATSELFFSEYIEGSSNNKALEIYNGTGSAINLATGGYSVQMFFNGNPVSTLTINLTGAVADGDVYVLAQSSANATILAQADQTNGAGWFNGDDAVVLRKGTTIIDAIGQSGFDPGAEWGTGLISTADNTLRRADTICAGDPNNLDAFDPSIEWEGFATDTFGGLGAHTTNCSAVDAAPEVTSTYPVDGAADFPIAANLSVTFSEPVDLAGSWFELSCSTSGIVPASVSGGPSSFTLDPAVNLVDGETCTLTVYAASVTDQDANDPPDNMVIDFAVGFSPFDVCAVAYTPIYNIQGSGATVALTGTQTTQGVVVADFEGPSPALRGFFIQDASGDGNPATSDGIFVFEGSNANTVSVGDVVRVTGTAGENQGQSQISVGTIVKCGTGTVTPTDVTFPVAAPDFLEQYEGMLVRLPQTMYVTEHFQLGRFGQVVLSSGGRLQQPTNVVAPGVPALALQARNNLNKIILDDASQAQNPDPILFARGGLPLSASNTLRGGDTATNIIGVLNYTWAGNSASGNAYRIRPINALGGYVNFEPTNPRPTSVPDVGGDVKVVGMNLLNYFNTFDGLPDTVDNCTFGVSGAPADCRGANTQSEFDRQWVKTVAAILAMNPDVIGVNEIENDGYGSDSAIAHLVDQLNAATAPGTYAFIDVDANTGQVDAMGADAIKVGMLYKPASVTPVGQTAALNTAAFVNGGDSAPRSRPSLAQAFEQNSNGQVFIVDVNHLKSKGSACDLPDQLDGQGNCNQVRVNSAIELMNWLASDPTGTADPDILLVGDYNSYAMEDPITTIKNSGFTNLISSFLGADAYSYVFNGQWGYLDHALGSASILSQVTGVGDYHINSDEPSVLDYNTDFKTLNLQTTLFAPDQFRVSDHDPVIVGLCTPPSLTVTVSPESLWPPNHKYVTIQAAFDATADVSSITLLSITSNEPDNGQGDGDMPNDIVIVDNDTFKLRAERSGGGEGRIYTITYQAVNSCGNTVTATATVTVAHNQ
jgi:predicted extracellular nuclease